MRFAQEPPYAHGTGARTAVLLVNLGTPEAPRPGPVRRYLREFLSDPRVVEIPRFLWWPILHGIILTLRPRKSAAKYASIWTDRGSPLLVHSTEQATLLRGYLGELGVAADVVLAMRYGEPSVASVLAGLRRQNTERILIIPMYPQYSATTTASALDAVFAEFARTRNVPEVRWVKHFHDDPGYIDSLKQSVLAHWKANGRAQDDGGKLVMSFHGVPKRTLLLGDPYHCECQKTGTFAGRSSRPGQGRLRRHVPVPLRQGGMAAAVHRADAGMRSEARACAVSTSCVQAFLRTAWRRSKRSRWKASRSSSRPVDGSTATLPA